MAEPKKPDAPKDPAPQTEPTFELRELNVWVEKGSFAP